MFDISWIKIKQYNWQIFDKQGQNLSGLATSVRGALASKLRGPGFKSGPGTVSGLVTIIMWGARPGCKLALS